MEPRLRQELDHWLTTPPEDLTIEECLEDEDVPIEEGQIEESNIGKHQGDDGIWPSSKTSSSSLLRDSEEIRKEKEAL